MFSQNKIKPDDKGKEEEQSYIQELVSQLMAASEGKRYIMMMSRTHTIENSHHLTLVLKCFSNEKHIATFTEQFESVIKSAEDLLAVAKCNTENKRLSIMMRFPEFVADNLYLQTFLDLLSPERQIILLAYLLDREMDNPEVLCLYLSKISIKQRYAAAMKHCRLIKDEDIIMTVIQLLDKADKSPFISQIKLNINRPDRACDILELFPDEEKLNVALSMILFLRFTPYEEIAIDEYRNLVAAIPAEQQLTLINELKTRLFGNERMALQLAFPHIQIMDRPAELVPEQAQSSANVAMMPVEIVEKHPAAQQILEKLEKHLRKPGKLHENRVIELRDAINATDDIQVVNALIQQQRSKVNPAAQQNIYPQINAYQYLNKPPKHIAISIVYRKLLETCHQILLNHHIQDEQRKSGNELSGGSHKM